MTQSIGMPIPLAPYNRSGQSGLSQDGGKARLSGVEVASRLISLAAFVAWLFLMILTALENGGALQLTAITAIPFFAHVISMIVMAGELSGIPARTKDR